MNLSSYLEQTWEQWSERNGFHPIAPADQTLSAGWRTDRPDWETWGEKENEEASPAVHWPARGENEKKNTSREWK